MILDEIAGAASLPAGGAAAAWAMGLAVALLQKVVRLEIHRCSDDPELERQMVRFNAELADMRRTIDQLAQQDPLAYQRFAESVRAAGKPQRAEVLAVAAVGRSMMDTGNRAMNCARQLRTITAEALSPHLLVAAELLMGAVRATYHLAMRNLANLPPSTEEEPIAGQLQQKFADCRQCLDLIVD